MLHASASNRSDRLAAAPLPKLGEQLKTKDFTGLRKSVLAAGAVPHSAWIVPGHDMLALSNVGAMIRRLLNALFNTDHVAVFAVEEEHLRKLDDESGELLSSPVAIETGCVGLCAKSGKLECASNNDSRLDPAVDLTGPGTRLCIPLCAATVVGVAQVLLPAAVSADDERVAGIFSESAGAMLRQALVHKVALDEMAWTAVLLQLARRIFEKPDSMEDVVSKIIVNAVAMLNCQRCSLFMVEKRTNELVACVFDVDSKSKGRRAPEIRFHNSVGIAGHVARTGEILNIPDAYQDPRFNAEVDKQTGFVTKSILCMPIYDSTQEIIGVAQLVNKASGHFDRHDERMFEAIAVYCGLGIQAVKMFEEARTNAYRAQVALDVLSYHSTATPEEAERLDMLPVPSAAALALDTFVFDSHALADDDSSIAVVRMFVDLGLSDEYHIPKIMLCRFALSVRKSYRKVAYHNWKHALGVAQTVFAMISWSTLRDQLTKDEQLALLIASLCHDLDHRGTNNAFQSLTGNALSQLYTTSTMEHHHFDQCVMILNTAGNNILHGLSRDRFRSLISLVEQAILATDLAIHFKTRGNYRNLLDSGTFNWGNAEHRGLLMGMLMTAADLAAIVKPFDTQKRTAEIVYKEFFEQGDQERQLGRTPASIFNRSKVTSLPKMQLGFIDFVCLPVYDALARQFPGLQCLTKSIRANRERWEVLEGKYPGDDSILTTPESATPTRHLSVSRPPGEMGGASGGGVTGRVSITRRESVRESVRVRPPSILAPLPHMPLQPPMAAMPLRVSVVNSDGPDGADRGPDTTRVEQAVREQGSRPHTAEATIAVAVHDSTRTSLSAELVLPYHDAHIKSARPQSAPRSPPPTHTIAITSTPPSTPSTSVSSPAAAATSASPSPAAIAEHAPLPSLSGPHPPAASAISTAAPDTIAAPVDLAGAGHAAPACAVQPAAAEAASLTTGPPPPPPTTCVCPPPSPMRTDLDEPPASDQLSGGNSSSTKVVSRDSLPPAITSSPGVPDNGPAAQARKDHCIDKPSTVEPAPAPDSSACGPHLPACSPAAAGPACSLTASDDGALEGTPAPRRFALTRGLEGRSKACIVM
eukprot:m.12131 g.12131  ORF g.12131 m.12131 type:complete len:1098 (-) comp2702_c0_seq1:101-3394(-)